MEISWESRINNGDSNPFNGNQTWLAGKSCINGGFNGNIICKCGFFFTMAMFDFLDLDLDYPVDLDYNIPKLTYYINIP
jgi:hypothetical protein